jgi:hypothetical protein
MDISPQPGRACAAYRRDIDVPITSPRRSESTWGNAGQRSAQSSVDNCHSDDAVINAGQLADLLAGADASVVGPSG